MKRARRRYLKEIRIDTKLKSLVDLNFMLKSIRKETITFLFYGKKREKT